MAVLIAVSVAIGPTTAGAAVSVAPAEMSMSNQGDMPCCPTSDDGKGVACVFKCLNFVAAMFPPTISLTQIANGLPSSLADVTLQGHIVPPSHPPPI